MRLVPKMQRRGIRRGRQHHHCQGLSQQEFRLFLHGFGTEEGNFRWHLIYCNIINFKERVGLWGSPREVSDVFSCPKQCTFYKKCNFWMVRMTSKCTSCKLFSGYKGDRYGPSKISGAKNCDNPMLWFSDHKLINYFDRKPDVIFSLEKSENTIGLMMECEKMCRKYVNCK